MLSQLEPNARERILSAAYTLFGRYGLGAVGVDRIVGESGVAKSTMYRHFRSKDALLIAVLERRDVVWTQAWLRPEVERRADTPGGRLLAIFDAFDEWFNREEFEGCVFVNCMLETRDPGSSVRAATVVGLAKVRELARELAEQAGAEDPESVAHQVHILMTGSIVAREQGIPDSACSAREVAAMVLDAAGIAR